MAVPAMMLAMMLAKASPAADPPGVAGATAALPSVNVTANSLTELRRVVGQVTMSEDACGTGPGTCTIDIVKPSPAATVRSADFFCATVPFGYVPDNDDVTLNGTPIAWDQVLPWTAPGLSGNNTRADVTALVAPVGNAAPAGVVTFTVTENPSNQYDGCILKVIWNDPTTTTNSVLVFFGHQETTGDTFVIQFAQPLTATQLLLPLEFSLGISFGFQGTTQFSQVDVNGQRLTTSAGGQDDGDNTLNGSLITAGGTGDTVANPPALSPPITPSNPDDERYNLNPFAMVGDTQMTISTLNPSNDDNILLANVFLPNVQVVTPEPPCPREEDDDEGDDDGDGLENGDENRLLTLLGTSDSDGDGILDGNDDANGNGTDDEDEDDDEDDDDGECPDDDDEDDDGVDDEDEDDDEDDD